MSTAENPTYVEPDSTPIHVLLHRVMVDVPAVAKSDKNTAQDYSFRGIDSLLNHIGPRFRAHGIVVVPEVTHSEHGAHYLEVAGSSNKSGYTKVTYFARVHVTYHFCGPAGDRLSVAMVGEALDSYDKATTKALSQAFKYALVQTLALPTHELDPDADNPGQPQEDRGRPRQQQEPRNRNRQQQTKPAKPILGLDADALTLAMDDVIDDERRKRVKTDFVRQFGKPAEVKLDDLADAWSWLTETLEVDPHAYSDPDGLAVCSMCGTMARAPWHEPAQEPQEQPARDRDGTTQQEPSETATAPRSAGSGDPQPAPAEGYSEEWINSAGKAALIEACQSLSVTQTGTVAELRARLLDATAPF